MGFLSKTYDRYRTGEIRLEDIPSNWRMSISIITDFINRYITDHFSPTTKCVSKFYKHENPPFGPNQPSNTYRTEAVFHNVLGHDIIITHLYPGNSIGYLYSWTSYLMRGKSEITHDKRFIEIYDQMRNNLDLYEQSKDEKELLKTKRNTK